MGRPSFTSYDFEEATKSRGIKFETTPDGSRRASKSVTAKAEQKSRSTGKLDPSVDPAVMVIRRSLCPFEETPDGRYVLSVGCPMDIESTCDTTGSMGGNVQTMIEVLPETYDTIAKVLPGYNLQLALGIFGDKCDRFVMNRSQFEMTAEKIVGCISNLVPERNGGDLPEDPQYAVFGAAYLTNTYTNRLGLKGYHFVITDAPMHRDLDPDIIERIYGKNVWQALIDNGHPEITRTSLPDVYDLFKDLHKRAHAFLIEVYGPISDFDRFYDQAHRVCISDTRCLPAIEAAIIGLTEGTLQPMDIRQFLKNNQVSEYDIRRAMDGLNNVRFGAQRELEQKSGNRIPQKGDIFASKQDLQPATLAEEAPATNDANTDSNSSWL